MRTSPVLPDHQERRLPSNVDPLDADLEDRASGSLAELLEKGLDEIVGYAAPAAGGRGGRDAWESGHWFLRFTERMYLMPGDSPMGLRLPIESLPYVLARGIPLHLPRSV